MRHLSLFSGIGGFSLALAESGIHTAAFCEKDPYARRVLAMRFPGRPIYDDVRTINATRLHNDWIGPIDIITGGFPCQDISVAGRGAGLSGERSGLWFEFARIIGEVRPSWAIIENVSALRARGLDQVLGSLAALGYDAEWHCIPAAAVGAPHRRDRIWIVAYARRGGFWTDRGPGEERSPETGDQGDGQERQRVRDASGGRGSDVADASAPGLATPEREALLTEGRWNEGRAATERGWWPAQSGLGGTDDGLSAALDGPAGWERGVARVARDVPDRVSRLRCLGNTLVPAIPAAIARAIILASAGPRIPDPDLHQPQERHP